MSFIRTYLRVLALLSSEGRLAATLALANIALAVSQFVEPVLFGHIVDALSGTLPAAVWPAAIVLAPLIFAWVGFGLFIIVASVLVAWFADRLAHHRRNLVLADYFEHVLQLFQETLLFNRSIAENLCVGKPDATEEQMRDAAARAQALDFIDRNPDGLEARIGERGRLLSGGERQRIAIARALLKDPPILILDEATSALDPLTEARVTTALDEVMKGRTTFVIAHRLATVRGATRILVFQNGRIIETGTFDDLVQRGGFFAEFVHAQFGAAAAPAAIAAKQATLAATSRTA